MKKANTLYFNLKESLPLLHYSDRPMQMGKTCEPLWRQIKAGSSGPDSLFNVIITGANRIPQNALRLKCSLKRKMSMVE